MATNDLELVIVTLVFDTDAPDALLPVLSKYVVLTRGHPGCRNVDLAASATVAGRIVVLQKWASDEDRRRHFDSDEMVEMATACNGILQAPPQIDLLDPISAQDLE